MSTIWHLERKGLSFKTVYATKIRGRIALEIMESNPLIDRCGNSRSKIVEAFTCLKSV